MAPDRESAMTQPRRASAKPATKSHPGGRADEPRDEGITRDQRGQVQPNDKKMAQRAGSRTQS
jgi:hypothetical protein